MPWMPNNLSGLFLWFPASAITGISNGGNLSSWADQSGSGNNLTAVSVGGALPTYQTAVINSYPVVRFTLTLGTTPYFTSETNNNSLNYAASGLTLFSVFKSNDFTTEQTICANDNSIDKFSSFIQGLNGDTLTNPSGFFFGYGKTGVGTNNGMFSVAASSVTFGFKVDPVGSFVIRHDRFRITDQVFAFGRYGADVATGIATTRVSTNNIFKIARDDTKDNYFNGDIAEIIAYNRMLSDFDVEQVNSYLIQKYALPAQQCTLFITGATSQISGSIPLCIGTQPPTARYFSSNYFIDRYFQGNYWSPPMIQTNGGTCTLFVGGQNVSSGNFPIYIYGKGIQSGSIPLFLRDVPLSSGVMTLFLDCAGSKTGITTLYIGSTLTKNSGISLYEYGKNSSNSGITLFLNSETITTKSTSLYIGSATIKQSGMPLATSGAYFVQSSTTLYTQAQFQQYPPITLYEKASTSGSANISLFLNSSTGNTKSTTLYTYAINTTNTTFPLYLKNIPSPSKTGTIPLFLANNISPGSTATSGLYKSFPLYLDAGRRSAAMPLVIASVPINTHPSSQLPLYILAPVHSGTINRGLNLFLDNSFQVTTKSKNLYIRGLGSLDGGSIDQASMPLYINIPAGATTSFFIRGKAQTTQATTLSISGSHISNGSVSMYVQATAPSGNVPLFIHGPTQTTSGINMFTKGIPHPNGFISMYTHGF